MAEIRKTMRVGTIEVERNDEGVALYTFRLGDSGEPQEWDLIGENEDAVAALSALLEFAHQNLPAQQAKKAEAA